MLGDLYSLFSGDKGYIRNFKFNIDKSEISSKSRNRFGVFSNIIQFYFYYLFLYL